MSLLNLIDSLSRKENELKGKLGELDLLITKNPHLECELMETQQELVEVWDELDRLTEILEAM
jgi:hypothetical protein